MVSSNGFVARRLTLGVSINWGTDGHVRLGSCFGNLGNDAGVRWRSWASYQRSRNCSTSSGGLNGLS